MTAVKFGTDGWRAVLDKDFNKENVNKVINAVSIYIHKESGFNKSVLIGYDPRNKADEYAFYTAEKLSGFGFNVKISNCIIATPVLAYSALKQNAYALMFTASHNPPEYLGIKFIPPFGGPAEDYTVKEITNNLENKFTAAAATGSLQRTNFEAPYIEHINKLIDFDRIKKSGLKINYDGHHGAAGKLFLKILDARAIEYTAQNIERDINFGGFMPDPKEEYLPSLKKLCAETKRTGFSNDGDGDRFGVFDENGIFISPNDIIAMLLKHLTKNRNFTGKLAKTIGASGLLDLYAEMCGVKVIETPVGFKHLGSAMRKDDVIIAGEESGGLSIKGHIPEKDGILANLLIMEMTAYSGKKLSELHNEFLKELNRTFINKRTDLKLNSAAEADEKIKQAESIKELAGLKVVKTNKIDGLKLYLEDKSTILIRRSGTEPLLRIYFESESNEKIERLKHEIVQHTHINKPVLYIIAGANGSGKSTLAQEFLNEKNIKFVNADIIAKEICPNNIESVKIKAGKMVIEELNKLLNDNTSFLLETTLSGKSYVKLIRNAKNSGYKIVMIYSFLSSPVMCENRIKIRVLNGGHGIPKEDIVRRFYRSRQNFWNIYKNLADEWSLYYNETSDYIIIAKAKCSEIEVLNENLYNEFIKDFK